GLPGFTPCGLVNGEVWKGGKLGEFGSSVSSTRSASPSQRLMDAVPEGTTNWNVKFPSYTILLGIPPSSGWAAPIKPIVEPASKNGVPCMETLKRFSSFGLLSVVQIATR